MTTNSTPVQETDAFETISEEEMERRLDGQHEEVAAMLEEARVAWESGAFADLEPLSPFLQRARERFEAEEQDVERADRLTRS